MTSHLTESSKILKVILEPAQGWGRHRQLVEEIKTRTRERKLNLESFRLIDYPLQSATLHKWTIIS